MRRDSVQKRNEQRDDDSDSTGRRFDATGRRSIWRDTADLPARTQAVGVKSRD